MAQQGPGGNGPGGGPGGPGGKNAPPAFQLIRILDNASRLNDGKKGKLSKEQAKKILDIIAPLRKQKTLTQKQAKTTLDKISVILTDEQKKLIEEMKPEKKKGKAGAGGNGPGGGMAPPEGGPGMGGPGGEGGPGGGPGGNSAAQKNMESLNPFNPPADLPMAQMMVKQTGEIFKKFENIAGIKKPAPKK